MIIILNYFQNKITLEKVHCKETYVDKLVATRDIIFHNSFRWSFCCLWCGELLIALSCEFW